MILINCALLIVMAKLIFICNWSHLKSKRNTVEIMGILVMNIFSFLPITVKIVVLLTWGGSIFKQCDGHSNFQFKRGRRNMRQLQGMEEFTWVLISLWSILYCFNWFGICCNSFQFVFFLQLKCFAHRSFYSFEPFFVYSEKFCRF